MTEENVMRSTIERWKEAHKEPAREFDFEMLCSILEEVHGESAVKIARNPLDEDHEWIHDTPTHNVGKVDIDEEGRLRLYIRHDNTETSADKLVDQIDRLRGKVAGNASRVVAHIKDGKDVEITDAYSHALVRDKWAGLPFDVVFAYYEKEEKEEKE